MSSNLSTCPDAEALAACAEGRLTGDERQAVLRHVLECADCDVVFTDTLRLLDEDEAGGMPPAVAASAPVVPADIHPVDPPERGRGRGLRFDSGLGQFATVGLPLAAGALFVLWLWQRPLSIAPSPTVVASSAPAPAASAAPERPAVELVDLEALPWDALPEIQAPRVGFGGEHLTGTRLCRFLGVRLVAIEVRARDKPAGALEELRKLVILLDRDEPLKAQYRGLHGRLAREGHRPGADELRPRSGCDGVDYDVARAAEWVLLASLTEDLDLLAHSEVVRGLALRQDITREAWTRVDDLARLVEVCRHEPNAKNWQSLRDRARDVVGRWQ